MQFRPQVNTLTIMNDERVENTASKANRVELRTELDRQVEITKRLIDFTTELLGSNRENYKRASRMLRIIEDLDNSLSRLESTASKLDEELSQ